MLLILIIINDVIINLIIIIKKKIPQKTKKNRLKIIFTHYLIKIYNSTIYKINTIKK